MPRVKSLTQEDRKNSVLRGEIARYIIQTGISKEHLADLMGISITSFYRKLREPNTFTLRDIRSLRNIFPGIMVE